MSSSYQQKSQCFIYLCCRWRYGHDFGGDVGPRVSIPWASSLERLADTYHWCHS